MFLLLDGMSITRLYLYCTARLEKGWCRILFAAHAVVYCVHCCVLSLLSADRRW